MKRITSIYYVRAWFMFALILATGLFAGCASGTETGTPAPSSSGTAAPEVTVAAPAGASAADAAGVADTADKEAFFLAEPASRRTIHIGYDGGLCQAAIPMAQLKGFFEAEGLTTELTKSGGTMDNARDAL
ncbi:MAG: hypothetical protein LBL26_13580, partial [Peptococcaceae bacterium]|nr:hypothetical protein [Peptococcaceae bacterium]